MRNLRVLNYFGSKVAAARHYPAPRHELIIEPFAGGAGYALLHHTRDVILVDANPDVIDAWKWLIAATPADVRALPLLAPGQDVRSLGLPRGAMLLIAWCLNQGATPSWHLCSWGVHHYHTAACYWGPRRREQTAELCSRVSHWQAFQGSYADLPNACATWFIDPPYVGAGRYYRHHAIDYAHLAAWCRERDGQVIACEAAGAAWLPFAPLRTATAARACATGEGARRRYGEVIWTQEVTHDR